MLSGRGSLKGEFSVLWAFLGICVGSFGDVGPFRRLLAILVEGFKTFCVALPSCVGVFLGMRKVSEVS